MVPRLPRARLFFVYVFFLLFYFHAFSFFLLQFDFARTLAAAGTAQAHDENSAATPPNARRQHKRRAAT
jgi:hypothetical protein